MASNQQAPACIEDWCNNRRPKRSNWHTMSENYRYDAEPYHHRCRQCYAGRLVRQVVKLTRARKAYACEGCRAAINPGDQYCLGLRSAGLRLTFPERVQVCQSCRNRYRDQGAAIAKPPNTAPDTMS